MRLSVDDAMCNSVLKGAVEVEAMEAAVETGLIAEVKHAGGVVTGTAVTDAVMTGGAWTAGAIRTRVAMAGAANAVAASAGVSTAGVSSTGAVSAEAVDDGATEVVVVIENDRVRVGIVAAENVLVHDQDVGRPRVVPSRHDALRILTLNQ